ncbi:MAG: nucleotide exchange factor GrpE [Bacillota bacterium]|jgi:molecular chaperone GrpE|nr:nucleotide exchange factor GrpE [Bacillota bacterium]
MRKKEFKEFEEENLNDANAKNSNAYAESDEVEVLEEEKTEKSEESKESDVSEAEEAKKAEEENLQNKLVRLQADFLNYKARTEKEKTAAYGNAAADVVKDLLEVADNLERAITAEANVSSLKEGVQMVYTQFMGILNKKGLKEIDALNKPFDANIHYGVAFDSECDAEDNTVIEVFQKGYTFNERVIRPSMVKIAKK